MIPAFSIDFPEPTSKFQTRTTFFLKVDKNTDRGSCSQWDHEEHFGENIVWLEAFVIGFALVPWQCWKTDTHYYYNYDVICDIINAKICYASKVYKIKGTFIFIVMNRVVVVQRHFDISHHR